MIWCDLSARGCRQVEPLHHYRIVKVIMGHTPYPNKYNEQRAVSTQKCIHMKCSVAQCAHNQNDLERTGYRKLLAANARRHRIYMLFLSFHFARSIARSLAIHIWVLRCRPSCKLTAVATGDRRMNTHSAAYSHTDHRIHIHSMVQTGIIGAHAYSCVQTARINIKYNS